MDLSDLPIEMIEAIARYLSVDDVCACSKVNTSWKKAFNSNILWKRYCTFPPNYFSKQRSKINYIPNVDNDEYCEAKQRVFKELFVRDNLFRGKFHTTHVNCCSLYCDSVLDAVDDVGNHWLFISCMSGSTLVSEHRLQVWKMNGDPTFHTCLATAFGNITRMYMSEMKLNKEKLVIFYSGEALIYNFAYPLYELTFWKKINCNTAMGIPNSCFDTKMISISNFIFGFIYTTSHQVQEAPPSFYIWTSSGTSVGSDHDLLYNPEFRVDVLYRNSHPVVNAKSNEIDKIVIHNQYFNSVSNASMSIIRVFDINTMKYIPQFYKERNFLSSYDICKNIVVLFHLNRDEQAIYGECFDANTGDAVYKVKFNINSHYKIVPNNEDGELVILETNRFIVYDITTKKLINSFIISGRGLDMLVMKSGLLLLEIANRGTTTHEVWNFRTGQKLYDLPFSHLFGLEKNGILISFIRSLSAPPKLIVFKSPLVTYPFYNIISNNVIVVTFW